MIRRSLFRTFVGIGLFCGGYSDALAVATYDEAVQGEISDNRLAPTQLSLTAGVNTLKGSMGVLTNGNDLEYVRIDLPVNHRLNAILLLSYDGGLDEDGTSFIGAQSGTTFSFDPNHAFVNIGNMVGWTHFGPGQGNDIGDDILDDMGLNGQGFTGPLTGSTYTFWIQQTGATTNYQLGFSVGFVPEPSAWGMLTVGAGCAVQTLRLMRRRRA